MYLAWWDEWGLNPSFDGLTAGLTLHAGVTAILTLHGWVMLSLALMVGDLDRQIYIFVLVCSVNEN